jgi:lipopolysaccharide export system permease protein
VRNKYQQQQNAELSLDSVLQEMITVLATTPNEIARDAEMRYLSADSTGAIEPLQQIALLREKVRKQLRIIDNRRAQISEFQVEIHKKVSIPFACLVFTLIGAPLGAMIRRRGAAVSVGASLSFFWVYWMFLIGGEELADRGFIAPALAMWAPNIAFTAIGLLLLYAVTLDRSWKNLLVRKR